MPIFIFFVLFSSSSFQYFHKVVKQLLPMAYNLLKRNLFGEILEAHIANRRHDDLDQLEQNTIIND